jgi:predicted Fe-S protein YdhL (DUF1289 family)
MVKEKLIQIEIGEWLYKDCFIQESIHPKLMGKYEVYKNDERQNHIGRCHTLAEAKKLCTENQIRKLAQPLCGCWIPDMLKVDENGICEGCGRKREK